MYLVEPHKQQDCAYLQQQSCRERMDISQQFSPKADQWSHCPIYAHFDPKDLGMGNVRQRF